MTNRSPWTSLGPWLATLICVGLAVSTPRADELPAVSSDGLHLMKGSKVRIAYVKPGATLSDYSRVKLLDCFVEFRKNWQREYNLKEVGLSGRISDKDADLIKKNLSGEFRKVFTEVLAEAGHPVVDEDAPDVLLLRPALINVDVTSPEPRMRGGSSRSYISSAGEMTLYLELYDSATSTLLARVIDPQADHDGPGRKPAGIVTNKAAADLILREWATRLTKHLGEVKAPAP